MYLYITYRIEIDSGRSTLLIEAAKKDDAAWYQCSAVNVAGTASTRAKLVVQRKYFSVFSLAFLELRNVNGKICEDTLEMPQSQNITFLTQQKKERCGTYNDKANTLYETTSA